MIDLPEQKRAARRRALWIVFAVVGLIVLSIGTIYWRTWAAANQVIQRQRGKLHDHIAGLRAERESKSNYFEPAEEGNSWPLIETALGHLESLGLTNNRSFETLLDYGESLDPAEEVERVHKEADAHIEALSRALRRTWVEPSYAYEEHLRMQLPIVRKSMIASKMMGDVALRRFQSGRSDQATTALIAGWGMMDHLTAKGFATQEEARAAGFEFLVEPLRLALEGPGIDRPNLERLLSALAKVEEGRRDPLVYLQRDSVCSRGAVIAIADGILAEDAFARPTNSIRFLFSSRIRAAAWFPLDERWTAMLESTRSFPTLERRERMERERSALPLKDFPWAVEFTSWNIRLMSVHLKDLCTSAIARTAVAVALHRECTGRYPKELSDLVPSLLPAMPLDAYSRKPLRSLAKDDAVTVYSIGQDGDDDGGTLPADHVTSDGDIVWTLNRRP